MPKYICTCPGCKANFEALTEEETAKTVCPACSCEVELEKAEKKEVDEGGCTGCAGCSGC